MNWLFQWQLVPKHLVPPVLPTPQEPALASPKVQHSPARAGTLGPRGKKGGQGQSLASSLSFVLWSCCARQDMREKTPTKQQSSYNMSYCKYESLTLNGSATLPLFVLHQWSENKQWQWFLQEGLGTSHTLNLRISLKNGKGEERKADQKTCSR